MPNRRTMPVAVGLAVAAAVVVGGVVGGVSGLGSDGSPEAAPGPTPTSQPAAPDARAGSPRAGGGSEASRPGTTPTSTPTTTTTGAGVEVIPPEATDAPSEHLPGLDDPGADGQDPTAAPDWRDLPDSTQVAQGRLATGYPDSLLPAAPRAAVLTSSVSPSGHRVQVALTARRGADPSTVVAFYRDTLLHAGFAEVRSPEVGGATSAAFRRGPDRVVVTVDPDPARTYSVYGTFDTDEA